MSNNIITNLISNELTEFKNEKVKLTFYTDLDQHEVLDVLKFRVTKDSTFFQRATLRGDGHLRQWLKDIITHNLITASTYSIEEEKYDA